MLGLRLVLVILHSGLKLLLSKTNIIVTLDRVDKPIFKIPPSPPPNFFNT